MLKRIPRRSNITPFLRELVKSNDIIIFKILLLTHKAVYNTAREYLGDVSLFVHMYPLIPVYYYYPPPPPPSSKVLIL